MVRYCDKCEGSPTLRQNGTCYVCERQVATKKQMNEPEPKHCKTCSGCGREGGRQCNPVRTSCGY